MLMIRFQRIGRVNDPAFRIVVVEKERAAKTGSILELLGTYNPRSKALTLDENQVKHWISKGAQPTGSIHNLLVNKGIIQGKKVNVLPKRTPQVKEQAGGSTQEAGAPAAAEAVVAPTEAEVVVENTDAGSTEVVDADAGSAEPAVEEAPVETPAA